MTNKIRNLRGSIVAGLDYQSDDWDMGQGEEGAATRAHEKKVDDLITAVREELLDEQRKWLEKELAGQPTTKFPSDIDPCAGIVWKGNEYNTNSSVSSNG